MGFKLGSSGLWQSSYTESGAQKVSAGLGGQVLCGGKSGSLVVEEMKPSGGRSLGLVSSLGGTVGYL